MGYSIPESVPICLSIGSEYNQANNVNVYYHIVLYYIYILYCDILV